MRRRCILADVSRGGCAAAGERRNLDRTDRGALIRHGQPAAPYRRSRVGDRRDRGSVGGGAAPFSGQYRGRIPRRHAPCLSLSRFAARANPREHCAALQCHRLDPAPDDRAGLCRVSDADPDCQLTRGSARLSCPEPPSSRRILRPAAVAPAIQAAADGGWLRPLFSNRAVLPRPCNQRLPPQS